MMFVLANNIWIKGQRAINLQAMVWTAVHVIVRQYVQQHASSI